MLKILKWALAGVAQWIVRQPANQRVVSSIPCWGTLLGKSLGSWLLQTMSAQRTAEGHVLSSKE